jgi:hypothetical protein
MGQVQVGDRVEDGRRDGETGDEQDGLAGAAVGQVEPGGTACAHVKRSYGRDGAEPLRPLEL